MMTLNKIRHKFSDWSSQVKMYLSFPHIWLCLIIIVLAVLTLIISRHLNIIGYEYWSSTFANIFAGLVTGLVICFISGVKQISVSNLRSKRAWLQRISEMLKDFFKYYQELLSTSFSSVNGNEELFNFIYDTGSRANWVNDTILQSSFNKALSFNSCEYSKKRLGYDALTMCDIFEKLHDDLYMIDINNPSKKEIITYFSSADHALRQLNSAVCSAISEIDIRLSAIERTII